MIGSSIISDSGTGDDLFFENHLLFGQHNKSTNVTDNYFIEYISLLLVHGALKCQQSSCPWKKFGDPYPRLFF